MYYAWYQTGGKSSMWTVDGTDKPRSTAQPLIGYYDSDDPDVARAQHRNGLRRLFRLQLREQVKFLEKSLATLQTTQMQASTVSALAAALPGFEVLREQVVHEHHGMRNSGVDRRHLQAPHILIEKLPLSAGRNG